jgi:hypothetical protein
VIINITLQNTANIQSKTQAIQDSLGENSYVNYSYTYSETKKNKLYKKKAHEEGIEEMTTVI